MTGREQPLTRLQERRSFWRREENRLRSVARHAEKYGHAKHHNQFLTEAAQADYIAEQFERELAIMLRI